MVIHIVTLYSKLAQKLDSDYECNYMYYHMYDILKKGYITTNKFGRVDLKVLDEEIDKHVNAILSNIKRDFNYSTMDNLFVIGGGGIELYDRLKCQLKNAVLCDNAQFINANAFELMGKMRFTSK